MKCVAGSVLVVVMAWGSLACTSNSQEKNYKLLEEDRPMFESEHRPLGRSTPEGLWLASLGDDSAVTVAVEDTPPPTGGRSEPVLPLAFEDRSQWEVVEIGPVDGRTAHRPVYFRDASIEASRVHPANVEAAFEQYVDDGPGTVLTADNAAAILVQPLKAAWDLVTLPVQAVLTPPWSTVYTPDYPAP